jgi:dUTP pyrophosphatase
VRLAVRRLSDAATLPTRAYDGDAAVDLRAAEAARLEPGARASIGTGIAVELPAGCAGLVLPRSGLALRHGIALVNAPGLVDSGYRGELRVLLLNTDRGEAFEVAVGDRIAQLLVVDAVPARVVQVAELAGSERGERGFGSSGVAAADGAG